MKKTAGALALAAAGSPWAQMTPVGVWHSIDDKTGETKAETDGAVRGRIEKLLGKRADQAARCVDHEGGRKFEVRSSIAFIGCIQPGVRVP